MKFSCAMPARRFAVIGAMFTAIGVVQVNFLPIGLALLALASIQQWRARRAGR